jgi:asparagine synthase (glutamine-hydrolysing)
MAHSVEARVPFLDHELCELAARIPPRIKLRGLREKHVLRDAVKDTVPAAVLRSRKRAMSGPINEWFREPLPPFAAELLSDSGLRRAGFFEPARVHRLLRQQSEARATNGELLMLVLSLQVWAALFLERSPEMSNHALSS